MRPKPKTSLPSRPPRTPARPIQSKPVPLRPTRQQTTHPASQSTPQSFEGSISLKGGRVDQLALKGYHETLEPGSPIVTLLSPVGSADPYYALFGWAPGEGLSPEQVPGSNTLWEVESGSTLAPNSPITLVWDNGAGLTFRREMNIDDKLMFTINQTVENTGGANHTLASYGILAPPR